MEAITDSASACAPATQYAPRPSTGFTFSASALMPPATVPDAPLPSSETTPAGDSSKQPYASRLSGVIPAGFRGRPQSARDKVAVGAGELISPEGFAAMFLSAGYEQWRNSEPNYGTDKGAFGERLGAAAAREESQSVFTYMVFAPLLHQDARYYVEGPAYSPTHRTLYAITRPFIARRDTGENTINGALLLGYAASAALSPTYYPSTNRNAHDIASTFGSSIGGAALGFFVKEFTDDALNAFHLRRKH